MSKKLHLGIITSFRNAGPQRFYRRLINSIKENEKVKVSSVYNPFHQVSLQLINGKKYWGKPFFLRLDGVYIDKCNTIGNTNDLNKKIFQSVIDSNGVIFNCKFSKNVFLKKFDIKSFNHKIIYTGTDEKEFNYLGPNYRNLFPDKELIIVCSSKWRNHKRLYEHINWFKSANNKKWQLIVIGDSKLNTQQHDNIYFTGWLNNIEIAKWYRTANVFLHLAWVDWFPNAAVEAFSCGLPIVTNNIGGTKEIVEKTNFGEIANIDDDLDFNYDLNLYKPPKIKNYNLITESIKKAAIKGNEKEKYDLKYFSINKCSKNYLKFIKGKDSFGK